MNPTRWNPNDAPPRYVRRNTRIYDHSTCKLCGSAYGITSTEPPWCRPTTCMACGTTQCMSNGLGHGTCSVCYIGLLPGWSGTDTHCRYAGCSNRAIARVPRKGFACREHLRGKAADHVYINAPKRKATEFKLAPCPTCERS